MPPALPSALHLLIAALAACAIAGGAFAARALSPSGAISAAVVGFVLFGFGGWPGAASLLLFFVTSTALSKYGKRQKEQLATYEKGDRRDAAQVIANGGVAVLCMVWVVFQPGTERPVAALLGAIAAANADTWATELGTLLGPRSRRKPIVLVTMRPGEPGQSGAVSVPGTIAAFVGAFVIALTVPFWRSNPQLSTVIAVTSGGLAGSLFDSLLGGSLQVQYRDGVTGRLTERRNDGEGRANAIERGYAWMNNDLVNFLATAAGAGLAALLS